MAPCPTPVNLESSAHGHFGVVGQLGGMAMSNREKSTKQDGWVNKTSSEPADAPRGSTEQRSAAELSSRAQRLSVLAEMTSGIAHDFRNVLAVIDSGLRLAERYPNDPKAASAFIAGAREGVARGLALTSQLLTFAKQREFDARAADTNELLKGLALLLRYGAGSQIRVVLDLSADIPDCLIDPSQFNAAILNLVINARDAMPKGGEIRISTAHWVVQSGVSDATPGNYVRVRVSDDGMGMPDQVLQNIFQPFFTTKGEQGTGLGVPRVHAFMRHIGGHVRVASEIGRGTTFDLFFPAVKPSAARPRPISF
jgi:signal transduction histidine kinase